MIINYIFKHQPLHLLHLITKLSNIKGRHKISYKTTTRAHIVTGTFFHRRHLVKILFDFDLIKTHEH